MVFQCFEMKRNTTQPRAPGVPVATSSVEAQIGLTCPPLKFGVGDRGQCDGDAPTDNRVITPRNPSRMPNSGNIFLTILIWFLIRLEDVNLIRFEFGVMISIWFCYVFDMVWVMV